VGVPDAIDFARLRKAPTGELLEPGVPGYEAAR
jgi:hypothetical protein